MDAFDDDGSLKLSLPQRVRARRRLHSFLIFVVAPTILSILYLFLIAAPRYVAEFRYTVYSVQDVASIQGRNGSGNNETVAGANGGNYLADFVVGDYLRSQQAVADLRDKLNLNQMFKGHFDPVFSFWWDNGSIESLASYWRRNVVDVDFDTTTGLGTVTVKAFTPEDAQRLASMLVDQASDLVNEVAAKPKRAVLEFAEDSLKRADQRLQGVLDEQAKFRDVNQTSNPSHDIDTAVQLETSLSQNLATMQAQRSALAARLSPTAPSIMMLDSQIDATQQEIHKQEAQIGSGSAAGNSKSDLLAKQVSDYQRLTEQVNFALQFYNQMLEFRESARLDAEVQHVFLETYVQPTLPQSPTYPKPVYWGFLIFIALTALWAIGRLFVQSVGEHLD